MFLKRVILAYCRNFELLHPASADARNNVLNPTKRQNSLQPISSPIRSHATCLTLMFSIASLMTPILVSCRGTSFRLSRPAPQEMKTNVYVFSCKVFGAPSQRRTAKPGICIAIDAATPAKIETPNSDQRITTCHGNNKDGAAAVAAVFKHARDDLFMAPLIQAYRASSETNLAKEAATPGLKSTALTKANGARESN